MKKIIQILCLLFILLLSSRHTAQAQQGSDDFDLKSHTMMLPRVAEKWEFDWSLGILYTRVPFDWVETALQVPLFNIHANMGLPYNFSVAGDFITLLVSNELRIGPRWNYEIDKFSFNIGIDADYGYGRLGFAGFDSRMYVWQLFPNASVGYQTNDLALSLQFELSSLLHARGTVGENEEMKTSATMFNGGSVGFQVEHTTQETDFGKMRKCN